MSEEAGKEKALSMIKAVYDDGLAEINGREYVFSKTTHKKRRKVFAFYTKVTPLIQLRDFSFLDWPEWEVVEEVIGNIVTFDGMQLTKVGGREESHWDKYPGDFITFISTALPVISYPFFPESGGN